MRKWIVDKPLKICRDPMVPLLFCHIEGEEEILAVATEEGNQQSRSNKAEVDHVVSIQLILLNVWAITVEILNCMFNHACITTCTCVTT